MALRSVNPATEALVREFAELDDRQIETKLTGAQLAFETWRGTSFEKRAKHMHKLAAALRGQKADLTKLMTLEIGKTTAAGEAEVEKCAVTCDYYADNAATFLAPEHIETDATTSYVRFDPIGVVLAVMPWNFPLWQVFRFLAPALMAGNVGLLKHASNVQLNGQAIEKLVNDVGFPPGSFQNLAIGSAKVADVINDPRVKAVTLTGSEYAGSQVAMTAGKAIKKTVLELGGSDPFIILADADLDAAAEVAVAARLQANAGQSCVAAKRFIVEATVADAFIKKLQAVVEKLRIGDPAATSTDVGPLASEQQLTDVQRQVDESVAQGATLVCGGKRRGDKGYFYEPAVLTDVKKGMPVYDQEVFGPVLPVITVKDADRAVHVANDSSYGLGATVFSKDLDKAQALATRIESGAVFINAQVKSDARLPFGGVKHSGYGRELSHYGIKEFVNIKTIWVK